MRDSRRIAIIGANIHPLFNWRQTRRFCDKGRAAEPYQLVDLVPSRHGGSVCEVVCVCVVFTATIGSLVEGVKKPNKGIKGDMRRYGISQAKYGEWVTGSVGWLWEKRLDEEKHTSHLVAMAVTRVSGANFTLASWCTNMKVMYHRHLDHFLFLYSRTISKDQC